MTNFLNKVKRIFAKNEMDNSLKRQLPEQDNQESPLSVQGKLDENSIVDLMHRLETTRDDCYSCEEAYSLLEEYVELVVTDKEAALLMPLVKNHVDMCPDCTDHYQILLNIIKSEADASDLPEP